MLIKDANAITGGLSKTSKMPGPSWGIPALYCKTGGKLRNIKGSVCEKCYASKGAYRWSKVEAAYRNRLLAFDRAWGNPDGPTLNEWIEAMATLIKKHKYFRWFDSGDLQSLIMFKAILQVVRLTPETKHWLPTKEGGILAKWANEAEKRRLPENLTIRLSSPMIDQPPRLHVDANRLFGLGVRTCNTTTEAYKGSTRICPAPEQNGECGDCRMCWNKQPYNISYKLH